MRTALTLALGALVALPAAASGDVRPIRFGGDLGNRYEPAELTVQAGDVVEWTGDFSAHPLRYRPAPTEPLSDPYTGPSPLRRTLSAAGDSFEYVCAIHGDQGMRGVVKAIARTDPRPLSRPPLLEINTDPKEPVAGKPVTFVASYVSGSGDYQFTSFAWDLDGDGKVRPKDGVDQVTTEPRATTTYAREGKRAVSVTGSTGDPSAAGSTTSRLTFVVAASGDAKPPTVSVTKVTPLRLRPVLRDGLTAQVRGSEPAQARITLLRGTRRIAEAKRKIGTSAVPVRLRLSAKTIATLRKQKSVRLTLRVVASDDDGNRTTLRRTILLR
ncbi:MAG: PKD domain-containing protein [Solirubrobacteraceae bacterium]|nr:PKD domain-containing protein [Solirubrobacteraceae bacterium]